MLNFSSQSGPDHDDGDIEISTQSNTMTAARALVTAMLKGIDTGPVRDAIKSSVPQVILLVAPSASWARAVSSEILRAHDNLDTITVTEPKKGRNDWVTEQMLMRLNAGDHVVIVSSDQPDLLPPEAIRAIDLRLVLPEIDVGLVRRAIGLFCGKRATGLKATDVVGMEFLDLVMALRQGSTARQCVERIKNSAHSRAQTGRSASSGIGPCLEDLPLPATIGAWAHDTLADLAAVSKGQLSPDQLRYAVLEGEPGTGKTLIAGALARSAGWRFQSATIGEWFNASDGNLGGVCKACVAFFDGLLNEDCAVGFLDEIDSLPDKLTLDPQHRQWWVTFINLMLSQIDRLRQSGKRVMLLAASNYYDRLDAALVRSGRLEQRLSVRVPQTELEVIAILAHYLAEDLEVTELEILARFALGATPATIAGWIRQARAAARHSSRKLVLADLTAVVAPADTRSAAEVRAVALHEAGHAVVANALGIGVRSVSIIERASSGGMTQTEPVASSLNRDELENMVTVYLAGRAADLVLGDRGAHSGAAADLEMAASVLARGYCQWGLYASLAPMDPASDEVFDFIGKTINRLLARATRLVSLHRDHVTALADALQARRLLKGSDIVELIGPLWLPDGTRKRLAKTRLQPNAPGGSKSDSQNSSGVATK